MPATMNTANEVAVEPSSRTESVFWIFRTLFGTMDAHTPRPIAGG